jgi:hypothetical protein
MKLPTNFPIAIREILWIALVYNDHNFDPNILITKCKQLAEELGIASVDSANNYLDNLDNFLIGKEND